MRPHYIDKETNIVYDTNNSDFEGWLTKQSMWLKASSCCYRRHRCCRCRFLFSEGVLDFIPFDRQGKQLP